MRSDLVQRAEREPVGEIAVLPQTLPAQSFSIPETTDPIVRRITENIALRAYLSIQPISTENLLKVEKVAQRVREFPQIAPHMEHLLHAGMYARTARLAANVIITSVLIKIPTVVIVRGNCIVSIGDDWAELKGYNVIPAHAGRKQIYVTIEDTEITMIFPSNAKTIEEAEAEFTDEAAELLSRRSA